VTRTAQEMEDDEDIAAICSALLAGNRLHTKRTQRPSRIVAPLSKDVECGFDCCPLDLNNPDQDPCACGDCEACE
jgi:hypothetical protein